MTKTSTWGAGAFRGVLGAPALATATAAAWFVLAAQVFLLTGYRGPSSLFLTGSAPLPPSMGIEAACLELQKSPAIRAGLPRVSAWVFYDEWTDFSFRFFGTVFYLSFIKLNH